MGKTPHTATYRGHWVKVKLRSGEKFVDQFIERTKNGRVIFKDHTVRQGDIKAFVPWGSNSPTSNRVKKVTIKKEKVRKVVPIQTIQEPVIKKKIMSKRRNATEIVKTYFENPSRFALTDFERKFVTETYMPSGTRRLSSAAVIETFFPGSSSGSVSYKTWGILDKILEQMTAPIIIPNDPSEMLPHVGTTIAETVPIAKLLNGNRIHGAAYPSDMNVAAAILCFGHECLEITADTAGRFEFAFMETPEVNSIRNGFQEHQVAVSPKAMAYNLKTLRSIIAQWYQK